MSEIAGDARVVDPVYVVGVDLGGTKIRAGLATGEGVILADRTVQTGQVGVPAQIVELVRWLSRDAGIAGELIAATGVGGAGVAEIGGFSRAPNLASASGDGFRSSLSVALGHPVVLENDVNVAALGELHYGVGRTHRDFVCISVGTGIGMGVVVDGALRRGAHGAAGEIGYLPLGADPLDPANHRRGPLEETLAGDALVERYREATGRSITAQAVFDRASADDPAALRAVEVESRWLAHAIAAVNAVLDTEVVVLAGGIGGRPELLSGVQSWLVRLGVTDLPVQTSSLGPHAPIAGAVRLALDATHRDPEGEAR